MKETHNLDKELCDLWSKRPDLDEAGWIRLFKIVQEILTPYRPQELSALDEERDYYVQEFFIEKVYRRDLLSRCDHVGALRHYYRNYLRDLIRGKQSRSKWEVADRHDSDSVPPVNQELADSHEETGRGSFDDLLESGFSVEEIAISAESWLQCNEEWVRLFVAYSNCPDADLSEPLVHLAKRYGIKSYHYKAEKLGFNWKSSGNSGFHETLIGQWLSETLGIRLIAENVSIIHDALKILCLQALLWAEQQEAAI